MFMTCIKFSFSAAQFKNNITHAPFSEPKILTISDLLKLFTGMENDIFLARIRVLLDTQSYMLHPCSQIRFFEHLFAFEAHHMNTHEIYPLI